MKMILYVSMLNEELSTELETIFLEESDQLKSYKLAIGCIKETLNKLKQFISNYKFENKEEEIHFFKKSKPEIFSQLIYYIKIFNIECNRPVGSLKIQTNYLKQQLQKLTYFSISHPDFYQYYRMNSTHFDDKYSIRGLEDFYLYHDSMMYFVDPKFSTGQDYMVAKIMAYDRLQLYLNKELEILTIKATNPNWEQLGIFDQTPLQWTDSKASLIELIYALYATGSINGGQKDIRELTLFFEKAFNVKLGEIYRTYSDIKIRTNPTKYIDTLKSRLLKKINDDFL